MKCKLLCKKTELQLLGTLNGGQSFRWKKHLKDKTEQWIGVVGNQVWILQENDDDIVYEVLQESKEDSKEYDKQIRDYFHLDLDLQQYYKEWSAKDPYFKQASQQFYGIRTLQQDPIENIFSFICSQNNHISRISSMVEKLATFYGDKICEIDDTTYYTFPKVENLAQPQVERNLRENGFGYRAKYISSSAQQIVEKGGITWLESLMKMEYPTARAELMTLTGIGPKVADCICLMSLGHLQAIPVDTHVYQIASKLYIPKLPKQKTVTEKVYKQIGDHFRDLYGPLAGWAQTVLFCADLEKFKRPSNSEEKSNKRQKTSKQIRVE